MDRLNSLPDELLVKILSFVPTRIAVSTSILSKRWEFLWMWLPTLEFVSRRNSSPALRDFIDKYLPLHRAPVIEFLRLELSDSKPEDIKRWVGIAVSRYVCELEISCYRDENENIFPSSFYTCKSVVILDLSGVILMDVPSMIYWEDVYRGGFVFNQLEHLKLCVCERASSNLLPQLLKDSPKLRVLDISHMKDHEHGDLVRWNQPSTVPECLLSSLQIFNWSRYFGTPEGRDFAVYILKNARCLKKVTIVADTAFGVPNLEMIKELAFSSRASSTCELVFVEGKHVVADSPETIRRLR